MLLGVQIRSPIYSNVVNVTLFYSIRCVNVLHIYNFCFAVCITFHGTSMCFCFTFCIRYLYLATGRYRSLLILIGAQILTLEEGRGQCICLSSQEVAKIIRIRLWVTAAGHWKGGVCWGYSVYSVYCTLCIHSLIVSLHKTASPKVGSANTT